MLVLASSEDERADRRSRSRSIVSVDDPVARRCAWRPAPRAAPPGSMSRRVVIASPMYARERRATPYRSRSRRRPRPCSARAPRSMLAAMIEATGLTKRLGGRTVVSDVSFRCEPGTVTGFLGPNGAGKTTTMRMLVGLSEPEAGSSAVLDRRYRELANPGRRVGVLLDASRPAPGPPRPRGARRLGPDDGRRRRARRRAARRSSASTSPPPASACASTRSACASGSGSRTRCSATPRC